MAAAISVATIRNTAYNVIKTQEVRRITNGDYDLEEYNKFAKDVLAASQAVPSTQGGGSHGHAWLIKDEAGYREFTGDATITVAEMTNPGLKATIGANDSHSVIAQKTQELAADNDTYHTQEGVKAGLRDLIISKVPKAAIKELEDEEFGFIRVTPLALLQHLKDEADVVDAIDLNVKLEERNEAIDFEGETTLKTFFQLIDKRIKELKKYNVASSHSELMVRYLLQLQQCDSDIIRNALDGWNTKSATDQTWVKFKEHFIEADKKRRKAIKASADGKANRKDFANNAQEMTPAAMSAMFASAMGTFAEAAEESIHAAIESKFNSFKPTKPGVSGNSDDLEAKLAAYKMEIAGLKRKLAAGDGHPNSGDTSGGGASEERYPLCDHCGRKHKGVCWRKPGNEHLAPEKWRKAQQKE